MTPRKMRLVADSVRKMKPSDAVEILPYSAKFAAEPLLKVIKTAIANARQGGADESKLVFHEIQISQGPALKRGIPVSRGQWHPIKKRMSHIRVSVIEKEVVVVKKARRDAKAVATEPVVAVEKPKAVKKVSTKTKK